MKTLRFVVVFLFVVLMSASFAAGQTETTGFPVEMNGGLMNSLQLSGHNIRLFTELHRDSCEGSMIREDEQNSFKKGDVLYLCENAVVNPSRVKSFLLWANNTASAKISKPVAPATIEVSQAKPAQAVIAKAPVNLAFTRPPIQNQPSRPLPLMPVT